MYNQLGQQPKKIDVQPQCDSANVNEISSHLF